MRSGGRLGCRVCRSRKGLLKRYSLKIFRSQSQSLAFYWQKRDAERSAPAFKPSNKKAVGAVAMWEGPGKPICRQKPVGDAGNDHRKIAVLFQECVTDGLIFLAFEGTGRVNKISTVPHEL